MELVLTCDSWQEAQRIADALLELRLVESIETFEVKAKYWWEGDSHGTKQVTLIVRAYEENFNSIEAQAAKLKKANTQRILLSELT